MIRRYGAQPAEGKSYRHRPGAYAVLIRGQDVLLTWQGGIHNEFQLPGGGIDPGESPLQALHREVYEETGWHITNARRIGAHRRFVWMPDYEWHAEKVAQIFIGAPTRQIGPPTEAEHDAVWVPLRDAPALLANDGDAAFVSRVLRVRG